MASRRLPPFSLILGTLLALLGLMLLRGSSVDRERDLTQAMVRLSAVNALQWVESRLGREMDMALLALEAPSPATAGKDKAPKGPALLEELLRQRGWLAVQRRDVEGITWSHTILPGGMPWPRDMAGEARAENFQRMQAGLPHAAANGLPAHLMLHAPLPVSLGGGVLSLALPLPMLEQLLREPALPAGLTLRLSDAHGTLLAQRGTTPDLWVERNPGTTTAPQASGLLTGWQMAVEAEGGVPEWLPQPSRLTLAMGLSLMLTLMLVLVLAQKTRRGQAAQQMLARALAEREAERRLSDIAANLPGAIYRVVRTPDGQMAFTYMSEGVNTLLGEPSGSSPKHSLQRSLTRETRERAEAALHHSATTLTPVYLEGDVVAADGRRLWLRTMASVHPLPDGSVVWDGVLLDSTEQRMAEERATLLAREVDHRAKNIMAVVRSLLLLTPRDVPPAQFVANLDGRLCAMARAHDLLAGQGWAGAELEAVVRRELATYDTHDGSPKLVWQGPQVRLSPGSVQPVEMILHELSTNAAKHGALSRAGGVVELRWAAAPQGGLLIDWRESGGPAISGEPGRHGFGFRLIHTLARHQLGGGATFLWSAEGLQCRIRLGQAAIAAIEAMPEAATPASDTPLDIPEPPARQAV
ncbi:hypothetical protein NON00_20675 [Roseomonas sp. GC11]|uniref:HWE histidine kinase domain-containing protein n=1 Tax=Roseomonas sp. GC11 TaxID=2950546 RepID=UPI0021092007|nr:HWE histidine kinase domain-containing protein [Roseomonas sp. GC11]MCQ4162330.1 hypothetical protein [Roseomonas sp. GC11]